MRASFRAGGLRDAREGHPATLRECLKTWATRSPRASVGSEKMQPHTTGLRRRLYRAGLAALFLGLTVAPSAETQADAAAHASSPSNAPSRLAMASSLGQTRVLPYPMEFVWPTA